MDLYRSCGPFECVAKYHSSLFSTRINVAQGTNDHVGCECIEKVSMMAFIVNVNQHFICSNVIHRKICCPDCCHSECNPPFYSQKCLESSKRCTPTICIWRVDWNMLLIQLKAMKTWERSTFPASFLLCLCYSGTTSQTVLTSPDLSSSDMYYWEWR